VDQEELELEQDATTMHHARLVALLILVVAAVALYMWSLIFAGGK